MLINCPECELQVSDKALQCPHCGFPLKKDTPRRASKKPNKRRRLPNGFGQISEIKGRNLRKPFRAMVTVGKDQNGRPISKPLKPDAYFSTYNEAYEALVAYNKNPYDLEDSITVSELYERWSSEHYKRFRNAMSINSMNSAWRYCSKVYNLRVIDLRSHHIKKCLEEGIAVVRGVETTPPPTVKLRIKTIFNLMLDYAVEYDLVDKNYSRTFSTSEDMKAEASTQKPHIIFTDEEMEILWDNVDKKVHVDMILIQCYSGWRPMELCSLKLADVDLENWTFSGGMKTKSGKNRIVPIHPRIRSFVEQRYQDASEHNSEFLFNRYGTITQNVYMNFAYFHYIKTFNQICEELNLNTEHRPHDGRKHFITMAKRANVDEYAIKYMVGHAIADITERVYTVREVQWLHDEIKKIE